MIEVALSVLKGNEGHARGQLIHHLKHMAEDLQRGIAKLEKGGRPPSGGFFGSRVATVDLICGAMCGTMDAIEAVEAALKHDREESFTDEQSRAFDSVDDRDNFIGWFKENSRDEGFAFSNWDRERFRIATEGK